ncbi:MAG: glutamate--tRNA ligase [Zoogloeaceae bacterium]|jgi:glutamyl-tRNA synthetase|nr:glutamate--tRNA ligase [Zoogloeaceae bacterium]
MVRTRFAPSPTGYLHIGGARTALFSWAYARHHGGQFILRVEDTDLERSTPEAVQAILEGMDWLGLDYDEGPFYQTRRMERYRAVLQEMLAAGTAYRCYMSSEELNALREQQRARGEKPRYDGFWRPEPGKTLPEPPPGVAPAIRFKNPRDGVVAWNDLVKGPIAFANSELDDLVIARADGTPTYNFCVVVDDWDMGITQVIRGDDHVNNTPRQINILEALGATPPQYAHLSMINGRDGTKFSKRHGAVSVMQYDSDGFLPEAVINYLARLGWSHGDDEVFSRAQFVQWFDLTRITPSAAQFNDEKLLWLNQQYMKALPSAELAAKVAPRLAALGADMNDGPDLAQAVALYVDRCNTLKALAQALLVFYARVSPAPELVHQHLSEEARPALADFAEKLADVPWETAAIGALLKETLETHQMRMPKLAMPLRVLLTGQTQTPSVDALITLMGRERTRQRIQASLG